MINGRHAWNMTTNYDSQYRIYEERTKVQYKNIIEFAQETLS